jgi:hypothetical protein
VPVSESGSIFLRLLRLVRLLKVCRGNGLWGSASVFRRDLGLLKFLQVELHQISDEVIHLIRVILEF